MPAPPLAALARHLAPDAGAVPDAERLGRFARTADPAAFELLVWRHGAMVWAADRQVPRQHFPTVRFATLQIAWRARA